MILFEFQFDPGVVAEDRTTNIAVANSSALQETYFVMPVRLTIGHVELLEIPPKYDQRLQRNIKGNYIPGQKGNTLVTMPWLELPLINLASVGLDAVIAVGQQGSSFYTLPDFGWRLVFTLFEKDVEVHSQVNGNTARVKYDSLVCAFRKFTLEVKATLKREVPELQEHVVWGRWLQEIE